MTEYLVPPAGDRLGRSGDQPEQHVGHAIARRTGLRGAHEVEGAGPVVQQRGIGKAQRGCDSRVALVTGGSDRVVAGFAGTQPPCRLVQVPARELGVEEFQAPRDRQRAAGPDRVIGRRPDGGRG